MKTLTTVIGLVAISTNLLTAQDLPIDKKTGTITFTDVVYVDDSTTTKDQLYSSAREWFARTFKSSQSVLQMDDKESGKLIGKGNLPIKGGMYLADGRVDFTISIYLKDGRYKYVITDFNHVSYKKGYSGGALEDVKPDCGTFNMMKKGWLQVKQTTKSTVDNLLADLKKTMNKTATSTDDEDW